MQHLSQQYSSENKLAPKREFARRLSSNRVQLESFCERVASQSSFSTASSRRRLAVKFSTAFRTFVVCSNPIASSTPSRKRKTFLVPPLPQTKGRRAEARVRLILSNIIKISVRVYFRFAKTLPFFLFFRRDKTVLRNIRLAPTPPRRVLSQSRKFRKVGKRAQTLTKNQGIPPRRFATRLRLGAAFRNGRRRVLKQFCAVP